MIGKTISHYKILEKLGEGGMGVVYKAQDTKLNRLVALKFLPSNHLGNENEKRRFIHEAKAAAALNHVNICTIYAIDEFYGNTFIAMEYIKGQTLKEKISYRALKVDEVLDIALQVADGLDQSHKKGIVHRDIKSANIMVSETSQVKIMDFGLAKTYESSQITQAGGAVGTVPYMSPEQAEGVKVDYRTDIYSFGVVLYEMITGQLPFRGDHFQVVLYSIVNTEPQSLRKLYPNTPELLDKIILKALSKVSKQRFHDILEMKADLNKVKQDLYITNKPFKDLKTIRKFLFYPVIGLFFFLGTVFLIKFLFSQREEYILKTNRMAVMPCENRGDIDDNNIQNDIISNLIISGLQQRQEISVLSQQRLFDLMKKKELVEHNLVPISHQLEIAREASTRWIINPILFFIGSHQKLLIEIIDVTDGAIKNSYEINWNKNSFIEITDSVTANITKFAEEYGIISERDDYSVKQVTTESYEALQLFQQGEQLAAKYYVFEAIQAFKQAITLDSTFATAHSRLAWCYFFLHMEIEGEIALKHAFNHIDKIKERNSFYIQLERAQLFDHKEEAKNILYKWLERYPDDKLARYRLGCLYYFDYGLYDEAIDNLRQSLILDPYYREAYNRIAYAYAHQGNIEEAIKYINLYVNLAPVDANAFDSKGEIYMNLVGDYKIAEEAFNRVIEIKPNFSVNKLAELYQLKGRFKKAENILKKSLDQEDLSSKGIKYFLLGRLYYQQQKYSDALIMVNKAIQLSSWYIKSNWLSSLIHMQLNQMKEAELYLKKFAVTDSNSTCYFHLLGMWYITQGKYDMAVEILQKSMLIEEFIYLSYIEHKEYYRQMLAYAYMKMGKLDEAINECNQIIKINPNWAGAYFLKGEIYQKKKMINKSIIAYEKFLEKWYEADEDHPKIVQAKKNIRLLNELH